MSCTTSKVAMVALAETAGSALYGMVDVLEAAGNVYEDLTRTPDGRRRFDTCIVAATTEPFVCGNRIPVHPDAAFADDPAADIVIVPELWLGPDESFHGRYPDLMAWLRRRHEAGAAVYSACSGSVVLAESGLLDGCDATSHWGYEELFRRDYPAVRFHPAPVLSFADGEGRIATAGGTTSWHDLVLHIIARHASPGEAARVAKVYLLKTHTEGQLPYRPLVRNVPHDDAVVASVEQFLEQRFTDDGAVAAAVAHAGIPARTLKRRFRAATGVPLIEYVQNLRIESAKRQLEDGMLPVDEIAAAVGYEDASFFRRLFKRLVGLTPKDYRRMFARAA